jgi:hypothetical protein
MGHHPYHLRWRSQRCGLLPPPPPPFVIQPCSFNSLSDADVALTFFFGGGSLFLFDTTDISDLELVSRLSNGKVDLTYGSFVPIPFLCSFPFRCPFLLFSTADGQADSLFPLSSLLLFSSSRPLLTLTCSSALDIFGGSQVKFTDLVVASNEAERANDAMP